MPITLVLLALLGNALGWRMVPFAHGATTDDVTVIGAVDKEIHLSAACPSGSLDIGTLVPGDPARQTGTDCVVTFGTTNSSAGADLVVSNANGSGNAMRCVTPTACHTDSLTNYADASGSSGFPSGATGSHFGMRLVSADSGATPEWSTNTAGLAGSGAWYAVTTPADRACSTSSVADGSCAFRWAAAAGGTTEPGTFRADVQYDVLAR